MRLISHVLLLQAQWWSSICETDCCDSSHPAGPEGCAQGQRSSQRGGCAAHRPRPSHYQPGLELLQWAGNQGTPTTGLGSLMQPEALKLFPPFLRCCSQDNAIYNLLPDIISRLSDPERAMTTDDFNTIMKSVAYFILGFFPNSSGKTCVLGKVGLCVFIRCLMWFFRQLFSYITKERQTESLVEKLCQRFRTAKWVYVILDFHTTSPPVLIWLFWASAAVSSFRHTVEMWASLSGVFNLWQRVLIHDSFALHIHLLCSHFAIETIGVWKVWMDKTGVGLWLMLHSYSKEGHFKLNNGKVNLGTSPGNQIWARWQSKMILRSDELLCWVSCIFMHFT